MSPFRQYEEAITALDLASEALYQANISLGALADEEEKS